MVRYKFYIVLYCIVLYINSMMTIFSTSRRLHSSNMLASYRNK